MNDEVTTEVTTSEATPDVETVEPATAEVPVSPWMGKRIIQPDYNPVEVLLGKLEKWLLMQPEWAVILSAPRTTRRKAITLISKRLLTIPNRYSNFGN